MCVCVCVHACMDVFVCVCVHGCVCTMNTCVCIEGNNVFVYNHNTHVPLYGMYSTVRDGV